MMDKFSMTTITQKTVYYVSLAIFASDHDIALFDNDKLCHTNKGTYLLLWSIINQMRKLCCSIQSLPYNHNTVDEMLSRKEEF